MYTTGYSSIKRISFLPYGSSTTRFGKRQGQAYSLRPGLYGLLGTLCASDLSEISEELLCKGINRIRCRFLLDLSVPHSERKKFFDVVRSGVSISSKKLLPGSDFIRGWGEFSLSEVFLHLRDATRYIGSTQICDLS